MTEDLQAASGLAVSRETSEQVRRFAELLHSEAAVQNLVSASTLGNLWDRHIVDSAQLARFAPRPDATWVDVGSGAGLPGLVLAALFPRAVTLVEPRRLRAKFLQRTIDELDIGAAVLCRKVERVQGGFDVITARAVAPLDKLLSITHHLARRNSLWVLPKGRNAKSELAEARRSWHYDVRAEPSITDPQSEILLLSNVRAKSRP